VEFHVLSGLRVGESQVRRVEKIASQSAVLLAEAFILTFPIHVISNDRMADGAEVNPDLMRTSSMDPDLEQ